MSRSAALLSALLLLPTAAAAQSSVPISQAAEEFAASLSSTVVSTIPVSILLGDLDADPPTGAAARGAAALKDVLCASLLRTGRFEVFSSSSGAADPEFVLSGRMTDLSDGIFASLRATRRKTGAVEWAHSTTVPPRKTSGPDPAAASSPRRARQSAFAGASFRASGLGWTVGAERRSVDGPLAAALAVGGYSHTGHGYAGPNYQYPESSSFKVGFVRGEAAYNIPLPRIPGPGGETLFDVPVTFRLAAGGGIYYLTEHDLLQFRDPAQTDIKTQREALRLAPHASVAFWLPLGRRLLVGASCGYVQSNFHYGVGGFSVGGFEYSALLSYPLF